MARPAPVHASMMLIAFCAALGAAVACRTPTMDVSEGDRLASGIWGGDRIQLNIESAGATTEYDCAHGTIDQPIDLDAKGRFSAAGTHVFEHGGPIREGEKPNTHPARYTGQVDGGAMSLTVTLTDSGQDVGTFALKRDVSPRLHKCL